MILSRWIVLMMVIVPCTGIAVERPGEAAVPDGATTYHRCAACHLADGAGVPGAFPPLRSQVSTFAAASQGREYLALVVATGLSGEIRVGERTYRGTMPAQSGLSDAEIAAVLNYVLTNIAKVSGTLQSFDSREVGEIRVRHIPISAQSVRLLRPAMGPSSPEAAGALAPAIPGVDSPQRARQNWMLNCQGCHRSDASGSVASTPAMAGVVARFLSVPGGRSYLIRVPGVATAPLPDPEVAELINWVLWTFDPADVPRNFQPFTCGEVRASRGSPLRADASRVRIELLARQRAGSSSAAPR